MVRGRRWGTRRGVASITALAALLASAGATVFSPAAGADAVADAEPTAAGIVAERIVQLDGMLRVAVADLPHAEAAVMTAASALEAARAAERAARVAAPGTPAPDATTPEGPAGPEVVDAAASAILGDLAPERATQARIAAEAAAADAVRRRDTVVFTTVVTRDERERLLLALEEHGQARTRWSIGLLDALGAPVSHENLRGLFAWIAAEGHQARALNPLATTMSAPGDRVANDHGVRAYPSNVVGIDATVRTLRNGRYDGILEALHAGDSALRLVMAVAASPWGTGENAVRRLQLDSR